MVDAQIDPESLRNLGRALAEIRKAGDGELRSRIVKSMRAPATRIAAAQRAAVRSLPGPAPSEWKAAGARNLRVDMYTTGRRAGIGVRLRRTANTRGAWLLNRGEWQHPTFGRPPMRTQRVRPGWFDQTGRSMHPAVLRATAQELESATRDLAERINQINR